MSFLDLSVQKIDAEVQIGSEKYPHDIRDLQQPGGLVLAIEAYRHGDDEDIEKHDPDEGGKAPFEREEEDRPDEVDDELDVVDDLGVARIQAVGFEDAVRDAHQGIEDAPRDGEEDCGRREGRLIELGIARRTGGQQTDDRSEHQRHEDGYDIDFDFLPIDRYRHSQHSFYHIDYYM